DDIGTQSHEFFGVCNDTFGVATPANVDLDVAAIGPAELFQCLLELGEQRACVHIVLASDKHANPPHSLRLLCSRRERPRCRAAEQRDELAAAGHSITSSARASRLGGTSKRSALAVLRLITSSNRLGRSIGRSAGLAPRRMRSA